MAFPVQSPPPLLNSGRTGIVLGVVPPPDDPAVDVEIHLSPPNSTAGYQLLHTIKSELMTGGSYTFVHGLPLTTQAYSYKARSVAVGRANSTFSAVVTARPRQYGSQLYPNAGQPVLGTAIPIILPAAAFKPASDTTTYTCDADGLLPGTLNVQQTFNAEFVVSPGLTIDGWTIYGNRANAGDQCVATLYQATNAGASVSEDVITLGVGAASGTSTLAIQTASQGYIVTVQLKGVSNVADAALFQVKLNVVPNSYTQVRP